MSRGEFVARPVNRLGRRTVMEESFQALPPGHPGQPRFRSIAVITSARILSSSARTASLRIPGFPILSRSLPAKPAAIGVPTSGRYSSRPAWG